ncbi:unnamed protein product [Ectocarpus sp. 12 AP-2014]
MLARQSDAENRENTSTNERLTRIEDSLLLLCAQIELAILKPRMEAKPKPRGDDQGQEPTKSELPTRGARDESIPPFPKTSQPFGDTGGGNGHSSQTPAHISESVGAAITGQGEVRSFAAKDDEHVGLVVPQSADNLEMTDKIGITRAQHTQRNQKRSTQDSPREAEGASHPTGGGRGDRGGSGGRNSTRRSRGSRKPNGNRGGEAKNGKRGGREHRKGDGREGGNTGDSSRGCKSHVRCFRCGQRGHSTPTCRVEKSHLPSRCDTCLGFGHDARVCASEAEPAVEVTPLKEKAAFSEEVAMGARQPGQLDAGGPVEVEEVVRRCNPEDFVFGSAAAYHCLATADGIRNYRTCTGTLRDAAWNPIQVVGCGDLVVSFPSNTGRVNLTLKNVKHVPQVSRNIISTGCLVDEGHTFQFDRNGTMLNLAGGGSMFFPYQEPENGVGFALAIFDPEQF